MALRTMFFVSYAFALRLCYVTLTAVDRCLNGNRKGIFTIIIKLISFKSMSCSQSDSDYITSYSEDERIELERRRERIQEEQYEERVEQEREKAFSIIFKEKAHKLFILPGLHFLRFCSKKIKFYFKPSEVMKWISKNTCFYCSLIYSKKWMWMIKRESFPSNYKLRIYNTFNDGQYCLVSDEDILPKIQQIYRQLLVWASTYEKMKKEKYRRFKCGEEVELDEEDEELFLSKNERRELIEKRNRILRRMIPPDGPKRWRVG